MRPHVFSSGYWGLSILLAGWMTFSGVPKADAAGTTKAPAAKANQKEAEDGQSDAAARQAAEVFESLYGQDVSRVRGTTEAADDVALGACPSKAFQASGVAVGSEYGVA